MIAAGVHPRTLCMQLGRPKGRPYWPDRNSRDKWRRTRRIQSMAGTEKNAMFSPVTIRPRSFLVRRCCCSAIPQPCRCVEVKVYVCVRGRPIRVQPSRVQVCAYTCPCYHIKTSISSEGRLGVICDMCENALRTKYAGPLPT